MPFRTELEFEETMIQELFEHGWEKEVLRFKTEEELIQNWANIIYENNRQKNRLGDYRLTRTEMEQILRTIREKKSPLNLNTFINNKITSIIRDNPDDIEHLGKPVYLKLFDKNEIAAGQSRYQIAEQPKFHKANLLSKDRRGDFMLLINGIPMIHVELKKNDNEMHKAVNQIDLYRQEGIFTNFFSLIQIFVAADPNEMVYFANPGNDMPRDDKLAFHWTNSRNEKINEWKEVVAKFLYIPMAHELIGYYTVADTADGMLKVLRPYQYYAASAVFAKVASTKWSDRNVRGGYVWHTTGSGKTLTSFKAAQLIAETQKAEKVVFLIDRIVLGNQTYLAYKGFASDMDAIQDTDNTDELISKLKSDSLSNTLIVTSIQKMSRIKMCQKMKSDIENINKYNIVFIVDECHRSTFGDMLATIKNTFPSALFFGFSGTPIMDENKKKMSTTSDIFGNELARYLISDGIADHNVLAFDPTMISTFDEDNMRSQIGLEQAKAKNLIEVLANPKKKKIYFYFIEECPMAGYLKKDGSYVRGIEDYIPMAQYEDEKHQKAVVSDILNKWLTHSKGFKFSGILATSSIKEACDYYRLFKKMLKTNTDLSDFKYTCMFDPNFDLEGKDFDKEKAMIEILEDYNRTYEKTFTIPSWARFKDDISMRLARKELYKKLNVNSDDDSIIKKIHTESLDLLIVVDQMLTGFDTKWLNVLYLDKMLDEENLVQAFSRTNRPFGYDKPHGIIRYYRKPHTMSRNIDIAFKHYSGNKPYCMFVEKLEGTLNKLNIIFKEIKEIFDNDGINNFSEVPKTKEGCAKFCAEFIKFKQYLEAAVIQDFKWNQTEYSFAHRNRKPNRVVIKVLFTIENHDALLARYKEIIKPGREVPPVAIYDFIGAVSQIQKDKIDADYLNNKFHKYIKAIQSEDDKESVVDILRELHSSFSTLSSEDQDIAHIIINDINNGDLNIGDGKSFRDYINEYKEKKKNDQIHKFATAFEVNEDKLRHLMNLHLNERNLNEYGRFDKVVESANLNLFKKYIEDTSGEIISKKMLFIRFTEYVRKFILDGGFEI